MSPTHLQHIGKMLRTMRKERSITQAQLAELCQLREATISDIEQGKANFEMNTLVKIASALQCYLDINLTPVA